MGNPARMEATRRVLYLDAESSADPCVVKAVEAAGGSLVHARTLDEASTIYFREDVDLLLIRDYPECPDLNEIVSSLKRDRPTLTTPVILLTEKERISGRFEGEDPVDVFLLPCEQSYLERRVRYNLDMQRILETAEERALKLASIIEISEAINQTLDAGSILYNIAKKLSEVMDLVRCSFILPDMENQKGEVLACKDDPSIHNLEIDLKNYPEILKVLETGRFVMIEDVAHDPLMAKVLNLTRLIIDQSILTLPLAFKGSVIGILQIRKKGTPKGFSTREVDFCQLIANAAAIALKNVQLYEDIENRNEILTQQKSELEKLSTELKAKNQELLELQQVKEDFVAMIVHDLRSPMTIIQGVLEILRSSDPTEPQKESLIKDALGETNRILDMIHNLLDISKLEGGEIDLDLEPLALDSLLRETVEPFRILLDKRGIELVLDIPEDLPSLQGDRSRLKQLFANLLSNALEHTLDEGRISILVNVLRRKGQEAFIISVQDTGIGIPEEVLPKIFDKFIRYQPEAPGPKTHHGTGLGLAIVKLFTEAHGGTVDVKSEVDKGSVFSVTLPISATS